MMAFLRALRNIRDVLGSALIFQFMYVEKNLFYYKEILHFAAFRSEWQGSVFYSRLEICFSGRIIFETQRFFYLLYVLRKQSWRNSFALKLYGNCYLNRLIFYHKVHGELVKWLCLWVHWGKHFYGKRPMQTFLDSKPMAREKLIETLAENQKILTFGSKDFWE